MSAATAALRGQVAANRLMLDTFTAYAPTGEWTTDADGMRTPEYAQQGTTPGKLQSRSRVGFTSDRTVNVAGRAVDVVESGLQLPLATPMPTAGDVGTGWEYELTSLGPATPPDLLGSRWLVVDAPGKSYMTARRLSVVRLS